MGGAAAPSSGQGGCDTPLVPRLNPEGAGSLLLLGAEVAPWVLGWHGGCWGGTVAPMARGHAWAHVASAQECFSPGNEQWG